ncbi:MAG: ATPase [Ignavibacteriae bacterium]|nr:ATPase [Ignavibacteriota bacterium]
MLKVFRYSRQGKDTSWSITTFIDRRRKNILAILNWFLLLLAILAIILLVAQYGFYLPGHYQSRLQLFNVIILYGFLGRGILKFLIFENRWMYFKRNWGESIVLALILFHLALPERVGSFLKLFHPDLTPEGITSIYIITTQFFLLLTIGITGLRVSSKIMEMNIQPSLLILLSFIFLASVGTMFLLLPRATVHEPLSFIDALFTATSAVCVTGLIVVDTQTAFTLFGHSIILFLIQIGGLGIMTLTTFFGYVMGGGGRLKEYSTMQSLLGEENLGKIRRTIMTIALVTFAIEAGGAFLLYSLIEPSALDNQTSRLFFSIFHSISAFCNAGFSLLSENLAHPMFKLNASVLSVMMILIILGGLGFPAISNLGARIPIRRRKNPYIVRLTLHTKIVLIISFALILTGTMVIFILEQNNVLEGFSTWDKFLTALFHSVSARTAGFNTLDLGAFSLQSMFAIILLMWIGASPASTGGGIKTTTVAIAFLNMYAIASGRNKIELFRKQISEISVIKAFSVILLTIIYIALALFLLLLTEKKPFQDLLFEIISAVGTVGFSRGVTPHLTSWGKFIIIISMLVGRVGLLAVMMALIKRRAEEGYEYSKEHVLVT